MKSRASNDAGLIPFVAMALFAFLAGIGIFLIILWAVARLIAA